MSKSFYIFSSGTIERKENTLCFNSGKEKRFIPISQVEQIFVFGENTFNTTLINFLSQNGVVVHFFNYYGYYTGSFYPREGNISGALIVKQVEHYIDAGKRICIAKEIVESAIHNLHRVLEKRGFREEVEKIKKCEKEVKNCDTIEKIMLLEAKARKIYYSTFEKITRWEFGGRTAHPPENPLNAMISFGNSLLYSNILKEIYQTALNPAISYLHEPGERRFSLALDMAELFKPVFVDRLIFNLINLSKIREEHFSKELNFAYLTEEGRKIFVKEFDELMDEAILHRNLKKKVKYRTLIRLELFKLIKHLLGEKNYRGLRVWW
jgi:CRISPR-associated protein Cas1